MVTKDECIVIFNAMIRGTPVSFSDTLIPLLSDYLTEINCKKSESIIYLVIQNPSLFKRTIPTIEEYFCRKYGILKVLESLSQKGLNINKTLLYYE
jgi:hypothetical protein